jgi:hypothetical protein
LHRASSRRVKILLASKLNFLYAIFSIDFERRLAMAIGLSERIRDVAESRYVKPAIQGGKAEFSIKVRDILNDLRTSGFPSGHTPQVCSVLQTAKFLRENGLEITEVEGPPSRQSTTVVVKYRVVRPGSQPSVMKLTEPTPPSLSSPEGETAEARAERITKGLRGLLKEEMAEFGGAEGFLRWVRGYDEEDSE